MHMITEPTHSFRGSGKLLISGEYVILEGATGLAIPVRYGQNLDVWMGDASEEILWQSEDMYEMLWFEARINKSDGSIISTNNTDIASSLASLIKYLKDFNPSWWNLVQRLKFKIDFPKQWGLGTSSTMIYTLSEASGLNPYDMLRATFGGSGYDIACASANSPILYSKNEFGQAEVESIPFEPIKADQFVFLYLGNKADTSASIKYFNSLGKVPEVLVDEISDISTSLTKARSHEYMIELLQRHEYLIGNYLKIEPVQKRLFPDFNGVIKSLGAWGGDFVCALSENPMEDYSYFYNKGYFNVFPFKKMIKPVFQVF